MTCITTDLIDFLEENGPYRPEQPSLSLSEGGSLDQDEKYCYSYCFVDDGGNEGERSYGVSVTTNSTDKTVLITNIEVHTDFYDRKIYRISETEYLDDEQPKLIATINGTDLDYEDSGDSGGTEPEISRNIIDINTEKRNIAKPKLTHLTHSVSSHENGLEGKYGPPTGLTITLEEYSNPNLEVGTYKYKATFLAEDGTESNCPSTVGEITTTENSKQAKVKVEIPSSSYVPYCDKVNIYRTNLNGGTYYLLKSIDKGSFEIAGTYNYEFYDNLEEISEESQEIPSNNTITKYYYKIKHSSTQCSELYEVDIGDNDSGAKVEFENFYFDDLYRPEKAGMLSDYKKATDSYEHEDYTDSIYFTDENEAMTTIDVCSYCIDDIIKGIMEAINMAIKDSDLIENIVNPTYDFSGCSQEDIDLINSRFLIKPTISGKATSTGIDTFEDSSLIELNIINIEPPADVSLSSFANGELDGEEEISGGALEANTEYKYYVQYTGEDLSSYVSEEFTITTGDEELGYVVKIEIPNSTSEYINNKKIYRLADGESDLYSVNNILVGEIDNETEFIYDSGATTNLTEDQVTLLEEIYGKDVDYSTGYIAYRYFSKDLDYIGQSYSHVAKENVEIDSTSVAIEISFPEDTELEDRVGYIELYFSKDDSTFYNIGKCYIGQNSITLSSDIEGKIEAGTYAYYYTKKYKNTSIYPAIYIGGILKEIDSISVGDDSGVTLTGLREHGDEYSKLIYREGDVTGVYNLVSEITKDYLRGYTINQVSDTKVQDEINDHQNLLNLLVNSNHTETKSLSNYKKISYNYKILYEFDSGVKRTIYYSDSEFTQLITKDDAEQKAGSDISLTDLIKRDLPNVVKITIYRNKNGDEKFYKVVEISGDDLEENEEEEPFEYEDIKNDSSLGDEIEEDTIYCLEEYLNAAIRLYNCIEYNDNNASAVIFMSWIDEATPYNSNETTWTDDIDYFNSTVAGIRNWAGVCFDVEDKKYHGAITGDAESPIPIADCARPPTTSFLTEYFDSLVEEAGSPVVVILGVDNSGSMHPSDIQPAYGKLVEYIEENYPDAEIRQMTYENERWLLLISGFGETWCTTI